MDKDIGVHLEMKMMEGFEALFILSELRELRKLVVDKLGQNNEVDSKMENLYNWVNEK